MPEIWHTEKKSINFLFHIMKKLLRLSFALITLSFISGPLCAQPELAIRIDDLGALHSVNLACIDTYRHGIAKSVEVMPVTAWFPEAVKMLKENPGLDVGLHLAITSEWENVKWRPLTHCPSLTDDNGYFYPMMWPNPAYPGQSIKEQKPDIKEIEAEFRAQIELALKNIPQISHITGHMLSTAFTEEVNALVKKLAAEYHLPSIDRMDSDKDFGYTGVTYDGPHSTFEEKEASFIKMLSSLENGKKYLFLDHPALNDTETQAVFHIGYEDVATDRQGVTDLLKSPAVAAAIKEYGIKLISINTITKSLPRGEAPEKVKKGAEAFLAAAAKAGMDVHSMMVLQHGKVIFEQWMSQGHPDSLHILNSLSKFFTATAVGLAINEGKLSLDDKLISFFPDQLPDTVSENLAAITIRDMLMMNSGHDPEPIAALSDTTIVKHADQVDWAEFFLSHPVPYKPGTHFCYNTLGTYMLSAVVQKVTGEKVINFLYPRLFRPLGITGAVWQESPQGINTGGFGLYLKTEDIAKMGQLFLQKGMWNGEQIIPAAWVAEATSKQGPSYNLTGDPKEDAKLKKEAQKSDWMQGYCYQMWQCRHNVFRADGANGQYLIFVPESDAVIAITSHIPEMQAPLDLVWKYMLPALKEKKSK